MPTLLAEKMPSSVAPTSSRLRLQIGGIVQGVGMRPFVYRLAMQLNLNGFVLNDAEGVVVEVEGVARNLESFLQAVRRGPPLARIDTFETKACVVTGEHGFVIRGSIEGRKRTLISPDIAMCDACAEEMLDPANRRHGYPFINCTDCGPRYTIIDALPYDRPNTSMHDFDMCLACEAEYHDPANRRYHAQPVSCFDCGPKLILKCKGSDEINAMKLVFETASAMLAEGKIIAVKGLGGFHLICDATNQTAVQTLRKRKQRPSKPFAVMFATVEQMAASAVLTEADMRLVLSRTRPITLVNKKTGVNVIAENVAPGIDRLGVLLPYTPLHVLLLEAFNRPVVATSANRSDEPILIRGDAVLDKLGSVIDAVLDHDRDIINACDDSIVTNAAGRTLMLRQARGHAPKSYLQQYESAQKILAVGAHQKNTIALVNGRHIVLSPHIGDLNSIDAVALFEQTVATFERLYGFEPDIVACDLHPQYDTTKWAHQHYNVITVQHHYAHALACMAEYGLEAQVLAFCFDGTGYGEDGTLWGGEVLLADPLHYERTMHLRPFRLLGGEKAVKEPRRCALGLLFECFSLEEVLAMQIPSTNGFSAQEVSVLHAMWQRGINAPYCSSVGRLFDAVASLSGLTQTLGYEGESGLLLEAAFARTRCETAVQIPCQNGQIDWRPLLRDILATSSAEAAASLLHHALCEVVVSVAMQHPGHPVVLCGGVFQNRTLVTLVCERLAAEHIRYYLPEATPVNDGGIALGQAYHALHLSRVDKETK